MKTRSSRLIVLSLLPLLLFPLAAKGQSGSSFYFMDIVPQRNAYNPAFISPYRFSMGIPALSGLHVQVDNNFLSWNSLIVRGEDDSLRVDAPRLLGKTGKKARLMASTDVEALRFSWRRGRNNYSAGLSLHADMQLVIGKESLSFVLQGPGSHVGENLLQGNSLDLNSYAALYFGYARELSRNLVVGGRFKLLQGLWNFHSRDVDIRFDIRNSDMADPDLVPYQYAFSVQGQALTNLPIQEDYSLGALNFYPFRNLGAALDLGMSYDFGNWNVSASANDLGFIVWNDPEAGMWQSQLETDHYDFQGMDFSEIGEGFRIEKYIEETFSNMLDTLGFAKLPDTVSSRYARALPASFNLSLSYTLRDVHCFGAVFRGLVYNRYFSPELIVSYTCKPSRNFAFCVSNTFTSGNMLNFGAAFVVNAGPLQLHLGVDRLNSFNVARMRTVNVNFGLNLVFGKAYYDWFTGR